MRTEMRKWSRMFDRIYHVVMIGKVKKVPVLEKKEKIRMEKDFSGIDTLMRRDELFLDSQFTMRDLAQTYGLNRTYVSQAINSREISFKYYINSLRIEYLKKYMKRHTPEEIQGLDLEYVAEVCGFSSKRTMNNILIRHLNYNFKELTVLGYWEE